MNKQKVKFQFSLTLKDKIQQDLKTAYRLKTVSFGDKES
jgi:hypothetical protein